MLCVLSSFVLMLGAGTPIAAARLTKMAAMKAMQTYQLFKFTVSQYEVAFKIYSFTVSHVFNLRLIVLVWMDSGCADYLRK